MKIICLVLLIRTSLLKNYIKVDTKLETEYIENSEIRYNSVIIYSGTGKEKMNEKINLELNLGFKKTLIGNNEKIKWGVNCSPVFDNSCEIEDKDEMEDFYYFKNYCYKRAEIFVKFFAEDYVMTEGHEKLKFDLIERTVLWPVKNTGVLGLSPEGDFANYLKEIYEEDIFILIEFSPNAEMSKNKKYDLTFILNPSFNKNQIKFEIVLNKKEYYDFPASLYFQEQNKSEMIFENKKLCLTSIQDVLLFLPERNDFCNTLLTAVCENISDCTKNNANLKSASIITILINSTKFSFTYEDYFYYDDNEKIKCRFGSLDIKSFNVCGEDTSFGVGKIFLQKFPLILSFHKSGYTTVKFLDRNILVEKDLTFWIMLAFLPASYSLFFIIYICCFKKMNRDNYQLYIPLNQN